MSESCTARLSIELSGVDRLKQERALYTVRSVSDTQSDSDDEYPKTHDRDETFAMPAGVHDSAAGTGSSSVPMSARFTLGNSLSGLQEVQGHTQAVNTDPMTAAVLHMMHDGWRVRRWPSVALQTADHLWHVSTAASESCLQDPAGGSKAAQQCLLSMLPPDADPSDRSAAEAYLQEVRVSSTCQSLS